MNNEVNIKYLDMMNGVIFVWSATCFMFGLILVSFTGANIILYFGHLNIVLLNVILTTSIIFCVYVSHYLVIDCISKEVEYGRTNTN